MGPILVYIGLVLAQPNKLMEVTYDAGFKPHMIAFFDTPTEINDPAYAPKIGEARIILPQIGNEKENFKYLTGLIARLKDKSK